MASKKSFQVSMLIALAVISCISKHEKDNQTTPNQFETERNNTFEAKRSDLPSNTGVKFDASEILLVDDHYMSVASDGLDLTEESNNGDSNAIIAGVVAGAVGIGLGGVVGAKFFGGKTKSDAPTQSTLRKNTELENTIHRQEIELNAARTKIKALEGQGNEAKILQEKVLKIEKEKSDLELGALSLQVKLATLESEKIALDSIFDKTKSSLREAQSDLNDAKIKGNRADVYLDRVNELSFKLQELTQKASNLKSALKDIDQSLSVLAESTRVIKHKDGSTIFLKADSNGKVAGAERLGIWSNDYEYVLIKPGDPPTSFRGLIKTRGRLQEHDPGSFKDLSDFNSYLTQSFPLDGFQPGQRLMMFHQAKDTNWDKSIADKLAKIESENTLHKWADDPVKGFSIYAIKFKGDPEPQYGFIKLSDAL